jgi:hypothetical protein
VAVEVAPDHQPAQTAVAAEEVEMARAEERALAVAGKEAAAKAAAASEAAASAAEGSGMVVQVTAVAVSGAVVRAAVAWVVGGKVWVAMGVGATAMEETVVETEVEEALVAHPPGTKEVAAVAAVADLAAQKAAGVAAEVAEAKAVGALVVAVMADSVAVDLAG